MCDLSVLQFSFQMENMTLVLEGKKDSLTRYDRCLQICDGLSCERRTQILCLPRQALLGLAQFSSTNSFLGFFLIYLFLAALGLCCCMQSFSSCGERGLLLRCGVRASHCGGLSLVLENGL